MTHSKRASERDQAQADDPSIRLYFYVSNKERLALSSEAQANKVTRSSLIRKRLYGSEFEMKKGRTVYASAVEAACQTYSGILRAHMESIVAAVIRSLDASSQND